MKLFISKKPEKLFTFLGIISICAMACSFALISLYYAAGMSGIAESISHHPYILSSSLWEIRNNVLKKKWTLDAAMLDKNFQDFYELRKDLADIDFKIDYSISELSARYLGDKRDITQLQIKLRELKNYQTDVIANMESGTRANAEQPLTSDELRYYIKIETSAAQMQDVISSELSKSTKGLELKAIMISTLGFLFAAALVVITLVFAKTIAMRNSLLAKKDIIFNTISNNIDDTIFVMSPHTNEIQFVSKNSERILGIPHEVFYRAPDTMYECLDHDTVRNLVDIYSKQRHRGSTEHECTVRNPRTGEYKSMLLRVYPVHDESQPPIIISIFSDITEMRKNQKFLEEALISSKNANAAKSTFLSKMSHEMRTPLNAVIGMTAIATAFIDDRNRIEDCLSKIGLSSKHLLALINDILDMSKIESGKIEMRCEAFDIRAFVHTINEMVQPQAAAKEVNFEMKIQYLPEKVFIGDQLRIKQILINLISNALKFTPKDGSVTVEVSTSETSNGKTPVIFTVTDTGIGMTEEQMKRIFDPFEQADHTIAAKYGGTGLGLAITKNLASLMEGAVSVTSEKDKGSVFSVVIPMKTNDIQPLDECNIYKKLQDTRVMVIDDDASACGQLAVMMDNMGFKTACSGSGEEAVALAEKCIADGNPFGVYITDWKMQGIDGIETVRELRRVAGNDVIIIIATGYDWREIKNTATTAGVDMFLSKPVVRQNLFDTLSGALIKQQSKRTAVKDKKKIRLDGKRILIVEDNKINMEITTEILRMAGAESEGAENGEIAVEKFANTKEGHYDAIIMDIQMPVMNGYDAAKKIRALPNPDAKDIPIIAMTANAFSEDVVKSIESGMDSHVAKPIETELLYAALDFFLNKENGN